MRYVDSLNRSLHQLMTQDPRVFVLGEDILDPYGGAFKVTKGLSSAFPDRVLTTPISEASLTGLATGMALRGLRPVVEIMFGDFLTLCADQIINSATKFRWMYNEQVEVPLVIRTPMGGRRGYGPTHSQTIETLFLGVPGLRIVAPSHFHDPGGLLRHTVLTTDAPVLFIENKLLYPRKLTPPDHTGRIDEFFAFERAGDDPNYPAIALTLVEGQAPDVTLIAYGGMAPAAAEAAWSVFFRSEIIVETIVPSLIKPSPLREVLASARSTGRVVIAEEGLRTSGWGAELASLISEAAFADLKGPIARVGAKDVPIPAARSLEDKVLPTVADIEHAIYRRMRE